MISPLQNFMSYLRKKVTVHVLLLLLFVISFCSNSNQPNINASQENEVHISKLHTATKADSKSVNSTLDEKLAHLTEDERKWLTGGCYIQLENCEDAKKAISKIENVDLALKFHCSVTIYKITEILDTLLPSASAQFNNNLDDRRSKFPFSSLNLLKSSTFAKNDKVEKNKSFEFYSENTLLHNLPSKSSKNVIVKEFENQTSQEGLTLAILQVLPNTIEKLAITTGICIKEGSSEVKEKILSNLMNLRALAFNNCDSSAIVTSPDKTFEFIAEIGNLKNIYFSSTEWFDAFISFICNLIKSNEKSCILKYYSNVNIHFVSCNLHNIKCVDEISQDDLETYEKYSMRLIIPFANLNLKGNLNSFNSIPSERNDMDDEKKSFKEILSELKNATCHNKHH